MQYESEYVHCRIRNKFCNEKKKQALDHHIVDESCSVHRPLVHGTSAREALPGFKAGRRARWRMNRPKTFTVS